MSNPLLSVIIPTYNRPQFLPRAVRSALQSAPDGNVEVIVVPNGGDETWKNSLIDLLHDSRIIISAVEKGHANVARNHGLNLAKGEYVRFLDDDDYLYPKKCQQQLLELIASDNYLAIANLDIGSDINQIFNVIKVNKTYEDFHSLILAYDRVTHVCSYLYRKDFLASLVWDEECNLGQDVLFIFDLICKKENINYIVNDFSTGVWVQHSSERISTSNKIDLHLRATFGFIIKTIFLLKKKGTLNDPRLKIAVSSLWIYAHHGFIQSPIFWSNKILKILKLDKNSRPDDHIYRMFYHIHPIVIELFFLPYRCLKSFFRKITIKKKQYTFWE